jgi:hypothetical protein
MLDFLEPARSTFTRLALTGCSALLAGILANDAAAMCNPDAAPDDADIAAARAAVTATCDCSGASTHGDYVKCAVQIANDTLVNRSCSRHVKTCASRSTCGKPGFVTCCITSEKGTRCKTVRSEQQCTDKGGIASGCSSCCDACPAPGSGPSCELPSSSSTTIPPPTTLPEATTTTTIP